MPSSPTGSLAKDAGKASDATVEETAPPAHYPCQRPASFLIEMSIGKVEGEGGGEEEGEEEGVTKVKDEGTVEGSLNKSEGGDENEDSDEKVRVEKWSTRFFI